MKMHIGVDDTSGVIHSMETTPANAHDMTQTGNLLHGKESTCHGDAGYPGAQKREELKDSANFLPVLAHTLAIGLIFKLHALKIVLHRRPMTIIQVESTPGVSSQRFIGVCARQKYRVLIQPALCAAIRDLC